VDSEHVAVTLDVRKGKEVEFERVLLDFISRTSGIDGVTGVHLIRPVPGADERRYGVLRSFESKDARDRFYRSEAFRQWERDAAPFMTRAERQELHGLEVFFRTMGASSPPRWKMFLITWLAVFPLAELLGATLRPALGTFLPGIAVNLIATAALVAILAWIVMPRLTRWFKPWLHPKPKPLNLIGELARESAG